MSRINDYPEATTMADDDILVIDGAQGTRKVKKSKFVEIVSSRVDGEIAEMRRDFQDGVDTIYNAIVAEGVTPASSTPQACAAGIATVADNEYASGKTDAENVTWEEGFDCASKSGKAIISLTNVKKFVVTNLTGQDTITCNWYVLTSIPRNFNNVTRHGTASIGTVIESFTSSEQYLEIRVTTTSSNADCRVYGTITRQAKILR